MRAVITTRSRDGDARGVVHEHDGETVTIVFTRKVQRTCVKRVVVALDDQHNVERDLQVDHPVAGFDDVRETCRLRSPLGTISLYRARR
jgi:hypothetical protein